MNDLVMMILTIISTIATVWSAIKPSSHESVRLEKGVVLTITARLLSRILHTVMSEAQPAIEVLGWGL